MKPISRDKLCAVKKQQYDQHCKEINHRARMAGWWTVAAIFGVIYSYIIIKHIQMLYETQVLPN